MDLRAFYLRDLTLIGSTVVPSGRFIDLLFHLVPGEIRPLPSAPFLLHDLHHAQRAFIAKKHVGKLVVAA